MMSSALRAASLLALAFFVFILSLLSTINTVFAQEQAGVGLSPSLIEEGADPGDLLERSITVQNLSDTTNTYYLYVKDITGVRDSAAPIYADENAEKTGYELSEWLTLGVTEVTLAPDQEQEIPVTIAVPETATPGSHFGGIFISLEPPKLRNIAAGVGFDVANIISILVSGDAVENARIREFSTDRPIYSAPLVEFEARIENKGNILVRPIGFISVKNMFGKEVVRIPFNENQGGVFPSTVRSFKMLWEDGGPAFGRYHAELSVVYGEPGVRQKTLTSEVSFWVLPMNILKPALIVLAVLLIGSYVAVKLYIRRRVYIMSAGRRVVRRRRQGGQSIFVLLFIVMLMVTAIFLLLLLVLFA